MKTTCFALGLTLSLSSLAGCGDDSTGQGGGAGGGADGTGGATASTAEIAATTTSTADAASTAGAGGEGGAGTGGGAADTIVFTVVLTDGLSGDPAGIEGIEVCAAEHDEVPCATSDADGLVTMDLPADSELMLRCDGAGYGPMYMTWAIGDADIDAGRFGLISSSSMPALFTLAGAEEWPDRGAIIVNVYDDLEERDQRVAGATFTISPAEGGGPVYVSEQPLPDPELEATTIGGPAVFFDLEDGEVEITIDHPTRDCFAGFGWPGASEKSLRSQIFAGGLSSITFVCPP